MHNRTAGRQADAEAAREGEPARQVVVEYDEEYTEKYTPLVYWCTFVPCAGFFLYGWDFGATTWALSKMVDDGNKHILIWTHWLAETSSLQSGVAALGAFGAVLGCLLGVYRFKATNRRRCVQIAGCCYAAGGTLQAMSGYIYDSDVLAFTSLLLGRVVYGVGIGQALLTVPQYIGEVVPSELRGALLCMQELSVVFGVCISYGVGYYSFEFDSRGWELAYQLEVIPAMVMIFGMSWLPDSPRWILCRGGSQEEALQAARKVQPGITLEDLLAATEEPGKDKNIPESEESFSVLVQRLFTQGGPIRTAMGLVMFQQLSGVASMGYYVSTIFETMYPYWKESEIMYATLGVGVVRIAGDLLSISVIDRFGRRSLLLCGFGFTCLAMASMSLLDLLGVEGDSVLFYASTLLSFAAFEAGCGTVVWVLLAEMFPMNVKDTAIALALIWNFTCNFIVTEAFAIGPDFHWWFLFMLFAVGNLVGFFFVRTYVPVDAPSNRMDNIEGTFREYTSKLAPCSGCEFPQVPKPALGSDQREEEKPLVSDQDP